MIAKNLIAALLAHTGPVFVDVHSKHDSIWVQAVKAHLLNNLYVYDPQDETYFTLDAGGYFGKDHDA